MIILMTNDLYFELPLPDSDLFYRNRLYVQNILYSRLYFFYLFFFDFVYIIYSSFHIAFLFIYDC